MVLSYMLVEARNCGEQRMAVNLWTRDAQGRIPRFPFFVLTSQMIPHFVLPLAALMIVSQVLAATTMPQRGIRVMLSFVSLQVALPFESGIPATGAQAAKSSFTRRATLHCL